MSMDNAAIRDFYRQATEREAVGYFMQPALSRGIARCEYCSRGNYLSDGLTCAGCGAPLPIDEPAFLYQKGTIDANFLAERGQCAPVNLAAMGARIEAARLINDSNAYRKMRTPNFLQNIVSAALLFGK
jgi:hypothetical protein